MHPSRVAGVASARHHDGCVGGERHRHLIVATAQDVSKLGLPNHVAVYLPQSYNFAGQLILVPASQVEAISIEGSDHMTFIVSGGVAKGTN